MWDQQTWRKIAAVILLVLLAAGLTSTGAPVQGCGEPWLDVDYVGDGIVGHRMDIYTPAAGHGPFPAIVTFYGSAWTADDKKTATGLAAARAWCPLGFAIVAINHRASSQASFPAQIHDAKAAIRYLRANAATYNINPERIGVSGGSSGGHLAALLGTSGDVGNYTIGEVTVSLEGDLGPHTDTSSRVQAVLTLAAPTNFLLKTACDPNTVTTAEEILIGGPLEENVELCALANPITYVDSGDPPFRIFHGEEDPVVPHCESAALYAALLAARVPVEYTLVSGAGHTNLVTPETIDAVVEFFRTTIGTAH